MKAFRAAALIQLFDNSAVSTLKFGELLNLENCLLLKKVEEMITKWNAFEVIVPDLEEQIDNFNCGANILEFAELIAENLNLSSPSLKQLLESIVTKMLFI